MCLRMLGTQASGQLVGVFSPYAVWVPGIEPGSSGLVAGCPYVLSHLAGSLHCVFIMCFSSPISQWVDSCVDSLSV